ncbi:MAG: hypothetical protein KUG79_04770 [Pseudomonadales bacterium]|nr:hypothetical protein [Pseudomonadales bacterium]
MWQIKTIGEETMKSLFTCLIGLAVFVAPVLGMAASKNLQLREIVKLQVAETGNFVMHIAQPGDTTCQSEGKMYYVFKDYNGVTERGVNALLSTAMTAFAAGIKVDIYYDDATSACMTKQIVLRK